MESSKVTRSTSGEALLRSQVTVVPSVATVRFCSAASVLVNRPIALRIVVPDTSASQGGEGPAPESCHPPAMRRL